MDTNEDDTIEYTPELAEKICELVAEGKSDREICSIEGFPKRTTFNKWKRTIPDFANQYARAKEDLADLEAEEIKEIVDEMPPTTERGFDSAFVQWQKNRIEARKWLMAKRRPKKYGDTLDITSNGEALKAPPAELTVKIIGSGDNSDAVS